MVLHPESSDSDPAGWLLCQEGSHTPHQAGPRTVTRTNLTLSSVPESYLCSTSPEQSRAVNPAREIKPRTSHSKKSFKSLHAHLGEGADLISGSFSPARLALRRRKAHPDCEALAQVRCRGCFSTDSNPESHFDTLRLFHECPECSTITGKQHWPVITRMFIQKDMNCRSACTAAKNRVLFT